MTGNSFLSNWSSFRPPSSPIPSLVHPHGSSILGSVGFIVGVIGVIITCGATLVIFLYCKCWVGKVGMEEGQISMDLVRLATGNFTEDNILGRGGFGTVYRGQLDGREVAVKRMNTNNTTTTGTSKTKEGEFEVELRVLAKVRHRSLLELLHYCKEGNERVLVYEYMSGGTLREHLFDPQQHGHLPLTWQQRVNIAVDVAKGVSYLHSSLQAGCFIHRDLKPCNVLLDHDLRAKVADFGLMRRAPDQNHSLVPTQLAGTIGYIAPECISTFKVTNKVDIYSYGVILLGLVTGRKAVNVENNSHIRDWFEGVLIDEDNIRAKMDHSLRVEDVEGICQVAKLAMRCTVNEPSQRPDMETVVHELVPLLRQWEQTEEEPVNEDLDPPTGIDFSRSLLETIEEWQTQDLSLSTSISISQNPDIM